MSPGNQMKCYWVCIIGNGYLKSHCLSDDTKSLSERQCHYWYLDHGGLTWLIRECKFTQHMKRSPYREIHIEALDESFKITDEWLHKCKKHRIMIFFFNNKKIIHKSERSCLLLPTNGERRSHHLLIDPYWHCGWRSAIKKPFILLRWWLVEITFIYLDHFVSSTWKDAITGLLSTV